MKCKIWTAGVFAAALFAVSAQAVLAQSLREELLFSVVQILAVNEAGDSFVGSGTTISSDDGLVLTNYHVVADFENEIPHSRILICHTISQIELPKCSATAKIIATNKESDLALIMPDRLVGQDGKTTKKSFQKLWKKQRHKFYAVPFKNTAREPLPRILDSITVWGYPAIGGSTITVSSGFVSGFDLKRDGEDTKIKFIKTDTVINPGNSGGAAFDSHFSFIGVPSNAFPGQLGFLIPMETIIEWLQTLHEKNIIDIGDIESIETYGKSFSDIRENDALQEVAGLLRYLNIMGNPASKKFRPDEAITKAEALAVFVRAGRTAFQSSAKDCLRGFSTGTWYAKPVCHAKALGWLPEDSFGNFGAALSEDEFTEIFNRAFPADRLKSYSRKTVSRRDAALAVFSLLAP